MVLNLDYFISVYKFRNRRVKNIPIQNLQNRVVYRKLRVVRLMVLFRYFVQIQEIRFRANNHLQVRSMPSTLVQWSEAVLNNAHVYFAMLELDMRSAQNTLRFKRALQSEELPVEKLRYPVLITDAPTPSSSEGFGL